MGSEMKTAGGKRRNDKAMIKALYLHNVVRTDYEYM